jgi:hypothetical protein
MRTKCCKRGKGNCRIKWWKKRFAENMENVKK